MVDFLMTDHQLVKLSMEKVAVFQSVLAQDLSICLRNRPWHFRNRSRRRDMVPTTIESENIKNLHYHVHEVFR